MLLLLASMQAIAQDSAWPGGVARIDIGPAEGTAPVVHYGDRRVLVTEVDGQWQAVVGVHLDAPLGSASIKLADGGSRDFSVEAHAYREQVLLDFECFQDFVQQEYSLDD